MELIPFQDDPNAPPPAVFEIDGMRFELLNSETYATIQKRIEKAVAAKRRGKITEDQWSVIAEAYGRVRVEAERQGF